LSAVEALRVVVHVNHPRELAPECLLALRRFQEAGIPVMSQGVLLRGVNDDPRILAELWRLLGEAAVKPRYLFQLDPARGTAHFRVDLRRALRIYGKARELCEMGVEPPPGVLDGATPSVPRAPSFALDLPGGGGKVPVDECTIVRENAQFYRVVAPGGASALYPAGGGARRSLKG
jgi:lysine 2,3-aminomutase